MASDDEIIQKQLEYYSARAAEYDEVFQRRGRYDRGEDHLSTWNDETRRVEEQVLPHLDGRDVLELACGTGLWTEKLVGKGASVTAVDGAQAMLNQAQQRLQGSSRATFVRANLFDWEPERRFERVFFGFWLSHVPRSRFAQFWRLVERCVAPGGRVLFVDSLAAERATAIDHPTPDAADRSARKLNDGRIFEIVKIYHLPEQLRAQLAEMGWDGDVSSTHEFFLFGNMIRR